MNVTAAQWMVVAFLLGACATDTPQGTTFDSSAGLVVVDIAGDGFVRCGDRRIPLEAIILELRQRTRRMTSDELARFVVQLRMEPQAEGSDAARNASAALNRLLRELDIMDVGQAKVTRL